MTKDKERDDAMIAEAAEMFPPDTVDVQSSYVIVHQLRASADIQDAQTKRETGWADTSDRACLMRKAADALDALLAKLQPAPKPDRAEVLKPCPFCGEELNVYSEHQGFYHDTGDCPLAGFEMARDGYSEARWNRRAEREAERPAVVAPDEIRAIAKHIKRAWPQSDATILADFILSLDGAKGDE